jgi:16S rRNA (cytidine1402-2'-O)-methyltransferase
MNMSGTDKESPRHDSAGAGQLFVVATPIGHLDDITVRAKRVLMSADIVLAEDTRVTKTLLSHIGAAPTQLVSANQYKEAALAQSLCDWLAQGKQVAFVSDAGTPGIADPGAVSVNAARARGFNVVPIPGPSALASIMSVAGVAHGKVLFDGFLPSASGARSKRLESLLAVARLNVAVVFFEAPHRVVDCCAAIAHVWGSAARIVIGRELTKKFEEIVALPISETAAWFAANDNRQRGEFVLLVHLPEQPQSDATQQAQQDQMMAWLNELVPALGTNAAAKLVSKVMGVSKATAYQAALLLQSDTN